MIHTDWHVTTLVNVEKFHICVTIPAGNSHGAGILRNSWIDPSFSHEERGSHL